MLAKVERINRDKLKIGLEINNYGIRVEWI